MSNFCMDGKNPLCRFLAPFMFLLNGCSDDAAPTYSVPGRDTSNGDYQTGTRSIYPHDVDMDAGYDYDAEYIDPFTDVVAVAPGDDHACALLTSGNMKCWWRNEYGELGDAILDDSATLVDVVSISSGVQAIVAGVDHTYALLESGGVRCWGDVYEDTPVDVIGLTSGVQAIVAGVDHTCALLESGGVKCWGERTPRDASF